MAADAIQAGRRRVRKLLAALKYPAGYYKGGVAGRRVQMRVLRDVGLAVYVTPDRLSNLEQWYL